MVDVECVTHSSGVAEGETSALSAVQMHASRADYACDLEQLRHSPAASLQTRCERARLLMERRHHCGRVALESTRRNQAVRLAIERVDDARERHAADDKERQHDDARGGAARPEEQRECARGG